MKIRSMRDAGEPLLLNSAIVSSYDGYRYSWKNVAPFPRRWWAGACSLPTTSGRITSGRTRRIDRYMHTCVYGYRHTIKVQSIHIDKYLHRHMDRYIDICIRRGIEVD